MNYNCVETRHRWVDNYLLQYGGDKIFLAELATTVLKVRSGV